MEKTYGIDLGTTYSCIAHVDEFGKPVVLQNFENERTTPSVVFFEDDGNIIVGNEAKNMLKTDPEKVVSFIKRSMGDPNFVFHNGNRDFKPEEISSFILKKLVNDASEKLGNEVKNVVITCPAYFGINEKEATKRAGEIAGLNVLSIINEPTAAALAYGVDQQEDQVVLVYDLGGGTFDITMIDITKDSIKVIVTGGDHELGGKDWDNALMNYFADKFKEETGVEDDIFSDPETAGDLQLSSEDAKQTLSQREKTKKAVLYETDRCAIEITREKFEELTISLLDKTVELTKSLIGEAVQKGHTSFDKILLVGGSTRMPQVINRLTAEFPDVLIESFDPDESVAKGAAVYGQQLAVDGELLERIAEIQGKSVEDVTIDSVDEQVREEMESEIIKSTGFTLGGGRRKTIEDLVSKSFGIRAYINASDIKVVNLIVKQTNVPAKITQTFATHELNQQSVEIAIFENEVYDEHVDENLAKSIGTGLIENLPANLPQGAPIEVTFEINKEGILDIHAVETTGNNECKITIKTTSVISGEELEEAKERSKGIMVS